MHKDMHEFHEEHSLADEAPLKSLRVAVRIAERLKEERYEDILFERHDAKWGELQFKFEPTENDRSKLVTWREKANTKRKVSQEKKEYKAAMDQAHKWRERDLTNFCRIWLKYDRRWWT